jgi:hypothetical protein
MGINEYVQLYAPFKLSSFDHHIIQGLKNLIRVHRKAVLAVLLFKVLLLQLFTYNLN